MLSRFFTSFFFFSFTYNCVNEQKWFTSFLQMPQSVLSVKVSAVTKCLKMCNASFSYKVIKTLIFITDRVDCPPSSNQYKDSLVPFLRWVLHLTHIAATTVLAERTWRGREWWQRSLLLVFWWELATGPTLVTRGTWKYNVWLDRAACSVGTWFTLQIFAGNTTYHYDQEPPSF